MNVSLASVHSKLMEKCVDSVVRYDGFRCEYELFSDKCNIEALDWGGGVGDRGHKTLLL